MRSRAIRSLRKWPKNVSGYLSGPIADGHHLAFEAWGDASDDNDTGLLAFAYLTRRFGPPMEGDSYKTLGTWVLTTPDPDVYLTISPSGSSLALCVGCLMRRDLEREFERPTSEAFQRQLHWLAERVAEERPDLVSKGTGPDGLDELAEEGWAIARDRRYDPGPDGKWGPESWGARAVAVVGRAKRAPLACDWRDGSDPIQHRVNTALLSAMKRLLRPVYIRDVAVNILGHAGRKARPSGFAAQGRAAHAKWKAEQAAKEAVEVRDA